MAKRPTKNETVDIDTTYLTNQRSMFAGGLTAQIGSDAFTVWSAIKVHADFDTGECWPGIRKLMEMTGLASATVQKAIPVLEKAHLLRVNRTESGGGTRPNRYIARERMDVQIGKKLICTVVVDYVPLHIGKTLTAVKKAVQEGDLSEADVWAQVDLIPGPDMVLDPKTGLFRGRMRGSEVDSCVMNTSDTRERLRAQANSMRGNLSTS